MYMHISCTRDCSYLGLTCTLMLLLPSTYCSTDLCFVWLKFVEQRWEFLIITLFFRLGLNHLRELRLAVCSLTARWYNMGISLGISTGKLEEFRIKYRDPDRCLTCVLAEWITNCNPTHAPPTWRKLVIAVASRVGADNPSLARRIAMQKYTCRLCQHLGITFGFCNYKCFTYTQILVWESGLMLTADRYVSLWFWKVILHCVCYKNWCV